MAAVLAGIAQDRILAGDVGEAPKVGDIRELGVAGCDALVAARAGDEAVALGDGAHRRAIGRVPGRPEPLRRVESWRVQSFERGRAFGREAARRLVTDFAEVDAVICFNDLVALGLLSGCAEIGRKVGQAFMVVGFDDIEDCAQVWPGLTTVSCGIDRFGQVMAETVLAWLEEGKPPPAEALSPVKLILRASTND